MRLKQAILSLFFVLPILACGLNPVEQLKEAAAEKVIEKAAETIIEQASDVENIDINLDDGSFSVTDDKGNEINVSSDENNNGSFSVTDEEGNEVSMSSEIEADITAIEGMGFNIPVPSGLTNGYIQRIEENGEDVMITATFDSGETTAEQFFDQMHQELTAAGFSYIDNFDTGETQPDPSAENFLPFITYEHPDDISFTILWGDGSTILGLSKTQ